MKKFELKQSPIRPHMEGHYVIYNNLTSKPARLNLKSLAKIKKTYRFLICDTDSFYFESVSPENAAKIRKMLPPHRIPNH